MLESILIVIACVLVVIFILLLVFTFFIQYFKYKKDIESDISIRKFCIEKVSKIEDITETMHDADVLLNWLKTGNRIIQARMKEVKN